MEATVREAMRQRVPSLARGGRDLGLSVPALLLAFVAWAGLVPVPVAQAASGLVAGYAFSEGAGTTTTDASGNGLAGTLTSGPAWVAGRNGTGLAFNGSNTYVNLGNPALLQLTGSMTLSAWVYETANVGDDGQIIAKSDSDSGWQLKSSPDTGVRTFAIAITNASGVTIQRYSNTVRALNTWYHVTGVFDASAQTLNLYVNGVLDNGALSGSVPASQAASSVNVNIGRRTGGFYIQGTIDDVRVYARALGLAEIQADMGQPVGGDGRHDCADHSDEPGRHRCLGLTSQSQLDGLQRRRRRRGLQGVPERGRGRDDAHRVLFRYGAERVHGLHLCRGRVRRRRQYLCPIGHRLRHHAPRGFRLFAVQRGQQVGGARRRGHERHWRQPRVRIHPGGGVCGLWAARGNDGGLLAHGLQPHLRDHADPHHHRRHAPRHLDDHGDRSHRCALPHHELLPERDRRRG